MGELHTGQLITLRIEKPAVGGAMIGRADGRVVLVTGAIPGEIVSARIQRLTRSLAFASTVDVLEPSADRRPGAVDLGCGGALYAHIVYPRQLDLKARVIADAFERIGRMDTPVVTVAPSREDGYRMRARLHIGGGRIGFLREGTHDVCDPGAARQLLPATVAVLEQIAAGLRAVRALDRGIVEVSENLDGTQRVVHLGLAAAVDVRALERLASIDRVTGLTAGRWNDAGGDRTGRRNRGQSRVAGDRRAGAPADVRTVEIAGSPYVTDTLSAGGPRFELRRHVQAFFQGNRYLLKQLLQRVVGPLAGAGQVVDLFAGVGLFSIGAAAAGAASVVAVEGDRVAAADLAANAAASGGSVQAFHQPVEAFVPEAGRAPDWVIVDPPRTGMSPAAAGRVVQLASPRICYVSCDVATLARDARMLVDAGYRLTNAEAFDLFPNTPHVEVVATFERGSSPGAGS